jgi:UDP-N-acetylglucosamine diphosphorylase / glucose-1-phosphate thymidylyltransferase / UDP-N-acetylgalactosamine diphosphorylase / glucosamine-1-phosphate N-acetyltransferase / galactosamine-1-phosphate N-acetyltransferase
VSAVYLYDDAQARTFEPFALTRPIGELRAGALLVRERWARVLGADVAGHVGAPMLAGFEETRSAPMIAAATIPAGSWIVNARFAPALGRAPQGDLFHADGRVAAVRVDRDLPSDALADGSYELDSFSLQGVAPAQIGGWWMEGVWDFVRHLVAMLEADIPLIGASMQKGLPRGAIGVGEHPVFIEEGATVEPSVCFDTTAGPILLSAGSRVMAFTRLVGPLFVGQHSILTTDRISASSIGDTCKVHGELSTTIMVGHSNKGHDGFVGHSMMGRWVNLGAGTITSNLKNTYGPVHLWTPSGERDTGMQFLGTMFGDHAKTAIGTRLVTGCVLGAGANVFGSAMMPKVVAPFAWGETGNFETYRVDKFLESVERMMARREQFLRAGMRAQLERAHAQRWSADS